MSRLPLLVNPVSVAGCLGYDVLVIKMIQMSINILVSVAGCLGYDVLVCLKTLVKQGF
ncbi:hypothetical protein [uncultured Gammaproteobacteria bacterium]|nr:hypothetical protein [uncultured Gammaproteobacteria bacterium]